MFVVTPDTDIRILMCPLSLSNTNQLKFNNENDQFNYFSTLPALEVDSTTYQRKSKTIRYPDHIDNIINYNYVMYQNSNYSNKWFYAFITDMEYINDGMTLITIETDVFQTWQFDLTYKPSFIEREHVSNDTIGLHTVPENLELGEYISNGFERDNELDKLCYIIHASENLTTETDPNRILATNLSGIYVSGCLYAFTELDKLVVTIFDYDRRGKGDSILNVYVIPHKLVNFKDGLIPYNELTAPIVYTKSIAKQRNLNGYVPKNNKLLTYPYNYLVLDNNNGTSNILQYEMFSTNDCQFEIDGMASVGGSIKCVPLNYKGESRFQQEGIMCGKYPTCSWVNDTYTNWLTQNAVNIGLGVASSGLSVLGGIGMLATGVGAIQGASSIVSGSLGVAQTLGQVYQHSILPDSAKGNINGGDINTCYNMNKFYFIKMSIKKEYAEIIDNYFSMYGYKVSTVKIPNLHTRKNWNFVKTIDINILADIPQAHLQEIKTMFNQGITLWHDPNTFLDYSQPNNII